MTHPQAPSAQIPKLLAALVEKYHRTRNWDFVTLEAELRTLVAEAERRAREAAIEECCAVVRDMVSNDWVRDRLIGLYRALAKTPAQTEPPSEPSGDDHAARDAAVAWQTDLDYATQAPCELVEDAFVAGARWRTLRGKR